MHFLRLPFNFPVSVVLQFQRILIDYIAPSPAAGGFPQSTIDSKIHVNPYYNPSTSCFFCLILESGCLNHRRNKTLWFVLNFEFWSFRFVSSRRAGIGFSASDLLAAFRPRQVNPCQSVSKNKNSLDIQPSSVYNTYRTNTN